MHVSYSNTNLMADCEYALWHYKNVGRIESEKPSIALIYGKLAHALLENPDATVNQIVEDSNGDIALNEIMLKNGAFRTHVNDAIKASENVKEFIRKFDADYPEYSLKENELKVEYNEILGFIDSLLTDKLNNKVIIRDYKFIRDFSNVWIDEYGAKMPWYVQYEYQLNLYAYMINRLRGVELSNIKLQLIGYSKRSGCVQSYLFEPDDLKINTIINKLETAKDIVSANENDLQYCMDCEYCSASKKLFVINEGDENDIE